jgi:hypothetical protein
MVELGRNIFWALLSELLFIVLAFILKDDKRKVVIVLVIGTILSGIIWCVSSVVMNIAEKAQILPANQIDTPPNSSNLALSKKGYASSVETFHYASRAFDGDPNTAWSSTFNDEQWVYVDLESTYTIQQIRIIWERAYGQAFTIDISDDGITWNTVYTETQGSPDVAVISVSSRGQYVRMSGIKRGTDWGFAIWEFEVYGVQ